METRAASPNPQGEAGSSPAPRTASLQHVPALDGVRGIAVALVLAYHFAVPGLGGGFLGVDLFFVLSGFLITTLLLGEHGSSGRIDLVRFWLRRARRLLPALFLLVLAAAAFAATTSPFDKGPLRWDILSSLFYAANWRFVLSGQSYFAEYAAPSPVRHLWSLAIEEQFYIVWPILVTVTLGLVRRARRPVGGRVAFGFLVVAAAASAVLLALSWNESDPSLAYYSTFTRAHELLIGAAGAAFLFYRPAGRERIHRHAGPLAAAGLAAVVIAGVAMSDTDALYYFGGSVLFSIAAVVLVLAVVAGHGSRTAALRTLEVRPLVWLGAVSYGVYLWHWPITNLLTPESTGLDGPLLLAARIGATLLIAAASFYLVERPIRRGRIGRLRLEARVAFSGAAIIAIGLAGLTMLATRGHQPLPVFVVDNLSIIASRVPGSTGTVGIVGDSVAMSLYPDLVHEAGAAGLNVASATFPGCSIGDTLRTDDKGKPFWNTKKCAAATVTQQAALVATYRPSVIFWHSGRDRYGIRVGDRRLVAGTEEWKAALYADWDRTLERLTATGARIELILPIYGQGGVPTKCAGLVNLSDPACTTPYVTGGVLRALYADWATRHADQVTVIDLTDALCPGNVCPASLGGVHLRVDLLHFTPQGSILVAKLLLSRVPAGALP